MKTQRVVALSIASILLTACAAQKSSAPAKSSQPYDTAAAAGYPQQQAAPGQFAPPPPAPPPPAPASEPLNRAPTPTTVPDSAAPTSRSAALGKAANDIETSQRELDVAGGDCRNACRALGSMDRATGEICKLAQSSDEQSRCANAKTRVYSARDKVRNTCGTCPEVTVERNAPIPSR